MTCSQPANESGSDQPDGLYISWQCEETRRVGNTTEGLLRLSVVEGGLIGIRRANLTQDQIYPLQPKLVDQLHCRN